MHSEGRPLYIDGLDVGTTTQLGKAGINQKLKGLYVCA